MTSFPGPVRRNIPLARPNIGAREIELVTEVLRSDVLALGSFAQRFEAGIAGVVGRREGIACSNGTAGLHLGVRALEIGEGDEVITTPFSFVASSNCLLYERAVPRFVDIEEESLGIDPGLMEDAATPRTRAILPVHVFGRPCRIEAVASIAQHHGWAVIEDACEGLGSTVGGRPLGSFGDVAVFAFYPNKQITTGEGGMVVTDDVVVRRRRLERQLLRLHRFQVRHGIPGDLGQDLRRDVRARRPVDDLGRPTDRERWWRGRVDSGGHREIGLAATGVAIPIPGTPVG